MNDLPQKDEIEPASRGEAATSSDLGHGAGAPSSPVPPDFASPHDTIGQQPASKEAHEQDLMTDVRRRAAALYEATINPSDIPAAQQLANRYRLPFDLVIRNLGQLKHQAKLDDAFARLTGKDLAKGDNSPISLEGMDHFKIDDSNAARKKYILQGGGGNFMVADNPDAKADTPFYERPSQSPVRQYEAEIADAARQTGVDERLIKAIMFMEATHGYYDHMHPFHKKSILPMNLNHDYWGDHFGTREQLDDPRQNILAGAKMIKAIQENLPPHPSIAKIATLYQDHRARRVTDYGARVTRIFEQELWRDLPIDPKYLFSRSPVPPRLHRD